MTDTTVRHDTRPEVPDDATMLLEFVLYEGSRLFASGISYVPVTGVSGHSLRSANVRDDAWVEILPSNRVGPWWWTEVAVRVNGTLWASRKPLAFWAGEPTDWATGIVRWEFPSYREDPAIYLHLTVRRMS